VRIALASDHGGFVHKDILAQYLEDEGHEVIDFGTGNATESVDYPDYARKVTEAVVKGEADRGILLCGTGIGMAIAANKTKGIRAANVVSPEFAKLARRHNDANVLALSGRFIDIDTNKRIVDVFLATDYENGRHQNRLDKVTEIEND